MARQVSIGKNAVLNVIKTVLSLVFPLVTFPYISRVLGVEAVGKYNFSTSIMSYFTLLAGLGVSTYAIREGAKFRECPEKFRQFSSEIFSINMYSTIVSYVVLAICLRYVRKFDSYRAILLILSFSIILTTINVNWVYNIVEDFTFLTVVTCIIQLLSVVLMFAMVKSKDDLYKYVWIATFATSGSGIFTFFYARKYVKLRFVFKPAKEHILPILIVFSSTVAVLIYITADTTILGWLIDDYCVGIYSAAAKIYQVVKQVLNAVVAVAIPRFAFLAGCKKRAELESLGQELLDNMIMICFPAMMGLFCMSRPIVEICAGKAYSEAYIALCLLSVALIFAVFANFFSNGILIIFKKEKIVMKATIVSAAINIILNFILIPFYQEKAAAFTTIVAEFCVFLISFLEAKKCLEIRYDKHNVFCTIVGCGGIGICCYLIKRFISNQIILLIVGIVLSVLLYGIVQIVLKNSVAIDMLKKIKQKNYV